MPENSAINRLPEGCVERCRGCAHRTLSALESQVQKEGWLKRQLAPWEAHFAPLQAVEEAGRWNYRDKICLSTVWEDGRWRFGLWARDELIEIPHCPIHSARARATLDLLAPVLPPGPVFPLAFYVQSGAHVSLVLKTVQVAAPTWLSEDIQQHLENLGLEGLWLHFHPAAGRRIFTKNGWSLVWGKPRSVAANGLLCGPSAFQQLIPVLYERALDEAEAFLAPSGNTVVVDLYCGTGASLARWTGYGARVMGVELGGEAVECAQQNAPQALVLRGQCKDRIPQLDEWVDQGTAGAGLLYVNPPRTGLEPEVLRWVAARFRPARMAYLSCSAGTLRRDLDVLTHAGYQLVRITPYDFFPQTHHVETLVLLRRLS